MEPSPDRPGYILLSRNVLFGVFLLLAASSCGTPSGENISSSRSISDGAKTATTQACLIDMSCDEYSLAETATQPGGAYPVEIRVLEPVWLRFVVDDVIQQEGVLQKNDHLSALVNQGFKIVTGEIGHLLILIDGREQSIQEITGKIVLYSWNELGELEDIPPSPTASLSPTPTASPTASATPTAIPVLNIYELDEGNAVEPITRKNVGRLMDLVHMETQTGAAFRMAYSPDSRWLIYKKADHQNDATHIHVLELDSGLSRQLSHPRAGSGWLWNCDFAFTPSQDSIVVSTWDSFLRIPFNEVSSETYKPTDDAGAGSVATGMVYSPDGDLVLVTNQFGFISLFENSSWEKVFDYWADPGGPLIAGWEEFRQASDPVFSEDGQYFAAIGIGIHIWRTQDYSLQYESEGAYYQDTNHLTGFGNTLAASAEGNIYFLDFDSTSIGHLLPSPRDVTALDYNADGTLLAVGTARGGLFVYDPRTNDLVTSRQAFSEGIRRLAFSPDGRWLATVDIDGELVLWAIP